MIFLIVHLRIGHACLLAIANENFVFKQRWRAVNTLTYLVAPTLPQILNQFSN